MKGEAQPTNAIARARIESAQKGVKKGKQAGEATQSRAKSAQKEAQAGEATQSAPQAAPAPLAPPAPPTTPATLAPAAEDSRDPGAEHPEAARKREDAILKAVSAQN